MNIGKIRGVLFCALIVGIYYKLILPVAHRAYFGFDPQYGFATDLVYYGLILTQIVVMRPGEKVQLTFAGGEVESFWGGFAALPNVFHFTVFLRGSALLWGIVRLKNDKYTYEEEKNAYINSSDYNTKYNVNSTLPYWAAQMSRIFGTILDFLFIRWTRAPQEYRWSALGYSMYAVGLIMVCLNSVTILAKQRLTGTPTANQSTNYSSVAPSPTPATGEPRRGVQAVPQMQSALDAGIYPKPTQGKDFVPFVEHGLRYNLAEEMRPKLIPPSHWFAEKRAGGVGRMSDGILYYVLAGAAEGEPLRWFYLGGGQTCLIVEPEVVGVIESSQPPKFVLNMSDEVLVGVYTSKPSHRERLVYDPPDGYWGDSTPWKRLHDFWGKAMHNFGRYNEMTKTKTVPFFVRGPSKDQSLPGRVPVGLVCF